MACTAQRHGLLSQDEQMRFLSRVTEDTATVYRQELERGTVPAAAAGAPLDAAG